MGCVREGRHEASWIISDCQDLLANVTKERLKLMALNVLVAESFLQQGGLGSALLHSELIKKVSQTAV